MKCLSVVPGSFPGEEVGERNHCLLSGGLRSCCSRSRFMFPSSF